MRKPPPILPHFPLVVMHPGDPYAILLAPLTATEIAWFYAVQKRDIKWPQFAGVSWHWCTINMGIGRGILMQNTPPNIILCRTFILECRDNNDLLRVPQDCTLTLVERYVCHRRYTVDV